MANEKAKKEARQVKMLLVAPREPKRKPSGNYTFFLTDYCIYIFMKLKILRLPKTHTSPKNPKRNDPRGIRHVSSSVI